jgi:c-di-GMP-binding flagellar brake protein YcgR
LNTLQQSQQPERRSYNRIPFNAEILMQCGNEEWSCNLLDISLKGMLVEPPDNLEIDLNNPCGMALFLGEDISIHARVNITRVSNGNWGLKWLEIDVNSLRHLRRLIELNSNDPALLTRELSELG